MGDDNRRRLELRDMEPPPSPPRTRVRSILSGVTPPSVSTAAELLMLNSPPAGHEREMGRVRLHGSAWPGTAPSPSSPRPLT